jgi:antitoxin component YwqK of YwqJK toxin-antitoxin module
MRLLILIIILFLALQGNAQLFSARINKYDEKGERHGKWVEYWDNEEKFVSAKGNYSHGKPIGKWKYYHLTGKRRMKNKYLKKGIKTKYYYENGKLDHKGWARLNITEKEIRYYWEGVWKYYTPQRKLRRIAIFEKGEEIKILLSDDPDEIIN